MTYHHKRSCPVSWPLDSLRNKMVLHSHMNLNWISFISNSRLVVNMPSTEFQDPAYLSSVLLALCANDTSVIRKAEKALKPFLKEPNCLPALFQQVQHSQDVSVRHHAALLLKKKLNVLYSKCPAAQKEELKQLILTVIVAEPEKPVRVSLAGAVASLAKGVLSVEGDWPQLFGGLTQLAQDPNEMLRGLSYSLLEQVIGFILNNVSA